MDPAPQHWVKEIVALVCGLLKEVWLNRPVFREELVRFKAFEAPREFCIIILQRDLAKWRTENPPVLKIVHTVQLLGDFVSVCDSPMQCQHKEYTASRVVFSFNYKFLQQCCKKLAGVHTYRTISLAQTSCKFAYGWCCKLISMMVFS